VPDNSARLGFPRSANARAAILGAVRIPPFVAIALVACGDPPSPAPSTATPPTERPIAPPEPTSAPPPPFPADRECGEPGATPTDLPPALARGRTEIGRAKLKAGDSIAFGTVSVKWDAHAWIGNRGTGHRGDAIVVSIDQAEANGGPYGATEEVVASRTQTIHVGPYRFDVRMSAAPIEVSVEVTRNICPESSVIESALPVSFWISTEATRQRTFDVAESMLAVALGKPTTVARLDVSTLGWRQWIEPVPVGPLRVRAGKRVVTIDEITRDGDEKVHARVRIEDATPSSPIVRSTADACGAPTSAATTTPPSLETLARVIDDLHLELGKDVETGSIVLAARENETIDQLQVRITADPPATPSFVGFYGQSSPALSRAGMSLLRFDPSGTNEVRVRRLQVACPPELRLAKLDAPTHVWLSTVGHTLVRIGPDAAPITLQLYPELERPTISASSAHAYWSTTIAPTLVGQAFTIDAIEVEVLDVVGTGGTVFDTKWTTPNTVPAVHVQLAISPAG
jgi:hypothetical protein